MSLTIELAPFRVGMIWAQDARGAIGIDGSLPWHIPEDLAHFKAMTRGHVVVHGRKSYEALPAKFRPLPGRDNAVLTRDLAYDAPGAEVIHGLEEYLTAATTPVWIVGGGEVYTQAMEFADLLLITEVDTVIGADTYAPTIDPHAWHTHHVTDWVESTKGLRFRVREYRRP